MDETQRDQLLPAIRAQGYRRVVIRPTVFDASRLRLADAERLVYEHQVRLRGWPFPYIPPAGLPESMQNRGDHVEAGVSCLEWAGTAEYWRFYRSGQFAHLRTCQEDYPPLATPGGTWLGVTDALYTLTEVFAFASGLAAAGAQGPGTTIAVGLHNTKDRLLSHRDGGRIVPLGRYACSEPEVTRTYVYEASELAAKSPDLALNAMLDLLEGFNWNDVSRDVLAAEQRRLLERRL